MGHNQVFEFIEVFTRSRLDPNRLLANTKTFLHLAVEQTNKSLVSYLLFDAKGVNPNANTNQGEESVTALHMAVMMRLVEIVELLLTKEGISVDSVSGKYGTSLHIGCSLGEVQIV